MVNPVTRPCIVCDTPMETLRASKQTCSHRCYMQQSRAAKRKLIDLNININENNITKTEETQMSVLQKFSKSELDSRKSLTQVYYSSRTDGHDQFEKRYVTGALQRFLSDSVQQGLDMYHEKLNEGYTVSEVFSGVLSGNGAAPMLEYTLYKPASMQAVELASEYIIVEQQYRAEIEAFNNAIIEKEVEAQIRIEKNRKQKLEDEQDAEDRIRIAAEVRKALGANV